MPSWAKQAKLYHFLMMLVGIINCRGWMFLDGAWREVGNDAQTAIPKNWGIMLILFFHKNIIYL